jgi:hypothetical protein
MRPGSPVSGGGWRRWGGEAAGKRGFPTGTVPERAVIPLRRAGFVRGWAR